MLQYSLTKGHGQRYKTVEFFGIDGDKDIQMNYHHRICAGVKACEFLPDKMKKSYTEVDELEGHEWAKLLAKQKQAEATNRYSPWNLTLSSSFSSRFPSNLGIMELGISQN